MKRMTALLLAALTMASLLAGCATGEKTPYVPTGAGLTWDDPTQATEATQAVETELELTMVYTPSDSYNPYFCEDVSNRAWMSLIYQGLFAVDSNYEAHPILCGSYWVSDDMQTYVFFLRSGATFSDGTKVTVTDVIASLNFAMESDMYRGRFRQVSSITASTGGGITIKLKTPYENFPLLLDVPILKQAELTDPTPLGTGPYRMSSVTGGMRLVRLSSWWASAELPINSSAITLRAAVSAVQTRDDFELADVDLVCTDPGDPDYAPYRCDYELWDCENGVFLYLTCSMSSWLFDDNTIRWALTYAIDREAIVEKYYDGYARAATLAASPLSPYYDSTLAAQYAYDPERFAQVIADENLAGNTVTILVNGDDGQRVKIAKDIAQMLNAAGLVAEVESWTGNDYIYKLAIQDYDLHLGQTKLSPNMDLSAFFASDGALSYGGIDNTALYALCLDALANSGNYYTLHRQIAEDGRLVPILFGTYAVCGERGVVTDLTPSRDNVFYYDLGQTLVDIQLEYEPLGSPDTAE